MIEGKNKLTEGLFFLFLGDSDMNITWDAKNYKENFSFVHEYGEDVINLLKKPEGSRVVDLGCGNGALSKKLADKGFHVIGIDASWPMLELAKAQYPQIEFVKGDACSFQLPQKADAVFSNAVFHWIDAAKQQDMLKNIAECLNTGGELVCEFGGKGCAETVHAALEQAFARRKLVYPRTFYFPTIGEYAPLLEKAGFRVEYAVLFDRPTKQKTEDGFRDWIRMFNKAPFEGMEEGLKNEIIDEAKNQVRPVLYHDGSWYIDYVRIRFRAVKA